MWRSDTKLNDKPKSFEELQDKIRKYLKRSGVGDAPRIRRIMFYALEHRGHFTFKELFEAVNGKVTTADVDKLVQYDFLTRAIVGNKNGKQIHYYECTVGKQQHSHMHCVECGKIEEFDDTILRDNARKITDYFGFEKHNLNMQISGICSECRRPKED